MRAKTLITTFFITTLAGCVSTPPKAPDTTHPQLTPTTILECEKPKEAATPNIRQDIYIQEAIKQIEINKSKLNSDNQKDFIAEYTYNASDSDSKISAKKAASAELKRELLEQIGIHVTSSLEINKQSDIDNRVRETITQTITTYTAGAVNMTILNEKWDGASFYIKGKISIDPNSVSEGIAEGLKAEANKKTIQELQAIIDEQKNTLESKSKTLRKNEDRLASTLLSTKSKESELKKLNDKLKAANRKLRKYEIEEKKIMSAYDTIMNRVGKSTKDAARLIKAGMTSNDVKELIGYPDSYFDWKNDTALYGATVVQYNRDGSYGRATVMCVYSARVPTPNNPCSYLKEYYPRYLYSYL